MDKKFRFYDNEDKCFRYFTLNEMLERHFAYYGSFDLKVLEAEKQQYIGVKDKNQVEIYEGDICLVSCKYFNIKDEKSKVILKDGCFCFQYGCTDDYVKTFNAWDTNSIEIIGNVTENSELWNYTT